MVGALDDSPFVARWLVGPPVRLVPDEPDASAAPVSSDSPAVASSDAVPDAPAVAAVPDAPSSTVLPALSGGPATSASPVVDLASPVSPVDAATSVGGESLVSGFDVLASFLGGSGGAAGTCEVLELIREVIAGIAVGATDGQCIELISLLEQLKGAVAGAQACQTEGFVQARAARERAAEIPLERRARGLGGEVGLARGESPQAGSRAVKVAHVLCEQMPHALTALSSGRISEFTAGLVVKEVGVLDEQARSVVDEAMSRWYGRVGVRRLTGQVRALVNQMDPAGQVKRREIAVSQRGVSVRPAPGSMAYLTALLPLEQAVACKKSLRDTAAVQTYSPGVVARSGAQAEADILVERVTGQAAATAIPVEIHVLMSDTALFGVSRTQLTTPTAPAGATPATGCTPATCATAAGVDGIPTDVDVDVGGVHGSAWIVGVGPLPAPIARDLLDPRHDSDRDSDRERVFLRRVLVDPVTGQIQAMDTRRRAFTGTLRRALVLRDDQCRTPWCNAPIAHLDHTHPYALGGRTNAANATGLCARCNYTKELPGWTHHKKQPDPTLSITTPTGHHYNSIPPPLLPQLRSSER